MRVDRRAAISALLGTSISLPILAALLRRASGAEAWRPATCMPDHCFCERIRDAAIRQPANTWSSLAFVAAAFWILGSDTHLRRVHHVAFGVAVMLIGYGSAFYHATQSFAGQFADVFGMYLLGVFIVVHAWSRLRPMGDRTLVALYSGINAALAVLLYAVPALRRWLFGALILAGLVLELRARRGRRGDSRVLAAAVVVLAIGFAAWVLDITRTVCSPDSVLQGHALWHVAGAISSLLIFHYDSAAACETVPS